SSSKVVKFIAPASPPPSSTPSPQTPHKNVNGSASSDSHLVEKLSGHPEVQRRRHTMDRDSKTAEHRFFRRSVICDSNATALDLPRLPLQPPCLLPGGQLAEYSRVPGDLYVQTSTQPGVGLDGKTKVAQNENAGEDSVVSSITTVVSTSDSVEHSPDGGVKEPSATGSDECHQAGSTPPGVVLRSRGSENTEQVREAEKRVQEDIEEVETKAVGTSPDGRFLKFDIEIGRGSFKTVYKGLDTETTVEVAWCELQDRKLSKSERQRFKEEAGMLKGLQHPNIVRFYDSWEGPCKGKKCIVLVTELMTSGTLKTYLKRFKVMKIKVLRSWCCPDVQTGYEYRLFCRTSVSPLPYLFTGCSNRILSDALKFKWKGLGLKPPLSKTASFLSACLPASSFFQLQFPNNKFNTSVHTYRLALNSMLVGATESKHCNILNASSAVPTKVDGVKPGSFDKVAIPEVKEIIEGCIRTNKDERYAIKILLNHAFFQEDTGVRVELAEEDDGEMIAIKLWLRIEDAKKLKGKYKDNEAIEFSFDLNKDVPEDVAQEMVESGYVAEGDHKTMAKAIKDRVSLIRRKREQRQLVREEQEKRKQESEQQIQQAQPEAHKPPHSQVCELAATTRPVWLQAEAEETEVDQQQHHYQQTSISHASEGGLDSGQGSSVFSTDSPHLGQLTMSYSCQPPSQPQTPYPTTSCAAQQQQHPGYSQPPQPMVSGVNPLRPSA
uniref:non-specific serine/threonine protein kinase n=1 Tax=Tetraodon nigroviridis TaxID=99883 RepID=H3CQ48_TETNG